MGQGLKPLVREEASDDYPAGYVVRTDPVAGAELSDGQTVRLFVSTGPSTVTGKMPNLLGATKERALENLEQWGFQNVTITGVYSSEEKGRVVSQSEAAGTVLDVNTHITLEVSEGQEIETAVMPDVMKLDSATAIQALKSRGFTTIETYEVKSDQPAGVVVHQSETAGSVVALSKEILLGVSNGADYKSDSATAPTQAATSGTPQAETVIFNVPVRTEAYKLIICRKGQADQQVASGTINPGDFTFTVALTGSGEQEYDLYIDGQYYQSMKVTFKNG